MIVRQKEALETSAVLKKVQEMNKLGSDISSSEDELLTGEKNYSPIDRRDFKNEFKFDKDDDRMSMSSLSSTEDAKIEEVCLCRSVFNKYDISTGGEFRPNRMIHPHNRHYQLMNPIHRRYLECLLVFIQDTLLIQVRTVNQFSC